MSDSADDCRSGSNPARPGRPTSASAHPGQNYSPPHPLARRPTDRADSDNRHATTAPVAPGGQHRGGPSCSCFELSISGELSTRTRSRPPPATRQTTIESGDKLGRRPPYSRMAQQLCLQCHVFGTQVSVSRPDECRVQSLLEGQILLSPAIAAHQRVHGAPHSARMARYLYFPNLLLPHPDSGPTVMYFVVWSRTCRGPDRGGRGSPSRVKALTTGPGDVRCLVTAVSVGRMESP